MTAAESTPTPTGYLDTCLVSGLARRDLRPMEQDALRELLRLRKARRLALVTSHITKEEIERLTPARREPHEEIYALLEDVPEAQEYRTDSGLLLMGVGGGRREHPALVDLKSIVPDVDDARHLFQAVQNNVEYFLTSDERTIIRHANAIEQRFGLAVRLPSALLQELQP